MLYPHIDTLMQISKERGLKNKLITNGLVLAHNSNMRNILGYLDTLTLSIDTINNETNEELGRGREHFEEIKTILDYVKNENLPINININTVVSKKNIDEVEQLGEFLNNYKINKWKFFKFMPLRETAEKNKNLFEITDEEFEEKKGVYAKFENISQTDFRKEKDIEEKYTLLVANGDIIRTENGVDIKKGNALYQNPVDFMYEVGGDQMKKIRTLVACDDDNTRNEIAETIKKLDYAELVGITSENNETYNKIIELRPEIVFTKYNMDQADSLDIIKQTKEKLNSDVPVFNMIIDNNIKEYEVDQIYEIIGNKLNSLITEPTNDNIINIMNDYKEQRMV